MVSTTLSLLLFLFPLAYSPGPGNMFFAATGARHGMRATLPANIGYHIATWFVSMVIGLGFVATLEAFPALISTIQIAGAAYVFYLAWKLVNSGPIGEQSEARPLSFFGGVILLLLNPKGYMIMALMFSQFLPKASDHSLLFVLWIASVFTLNNLVAFTLWAWVGDRLAVHFRTKSRSRGLNIFFGGTLAVVAVWMLLS